jgi:hypothetical protein
MEHLLHALMIAVQIVGASASGGGPYLDIFPTVFFYVIARSPALADDEAI